MPNNNYLPYKARITAIRQETADVRTYRLQRINSGKLPAFAAGRFTMVGWPGVVEAPISLSAFNDSGGFSLTIRAVGRVTEYLTRLGPGDDLYCRGPYGRGWPLEQARDSELLLVAGGLGLAPLRPVIEAAITGNLFKSVSLVYGCRDPESLLFRAEYEDWQQAMPVLLTVDEVPPGSGWEHEVGLVTGLIDRLAINPATSYAFVCGPEIMMRFVSRQLLRLGLAPERIIVSLERRMRCGLGQCGHCQHGPLFVCKDGPVFHYGEVSSLPDTLL